MTELSPSLPKGSWFLVTGLTGLVASHIAKQLLERGYKVRGTVRDLTKASWLRDDLFKSDSDKGNLDIVVVSDLGADNAFDAAVKGMSAVIHLATPVDLDPDPNNVVPKAVKGVASILNAALDEPSVKEFVYTSSYSAAAVSIPGRDVHVQRDTWNEMAVQMAWAPPPYTPERAFLVYAASKVAAEKEVWKFISEQTPHFNVNVISPSAIIGQPLNKVHAESNGAWMKLLIYGQAAIISQLHQTYWVDVKDVALLHIALVLDPEVKNSRLQSWGLPATWNDILASIRRQWPEQEFMADQPPADDLGKLSTDSSQSLELLEKWGHQSGWTPLDITVEDNLSYYKSQ